MTKAGTDTLLAITFQSEIIEWRGPAPFFFAAIPDAHTDDVRAAARAASYGWGVVPVDASIAGMSFQTSLFPRDGGYLLPIKAAIRARTGLGLGDRPMIAIRVAIPRGGR